jgi:hypothetical protein
MSSTMILTPKLFRALLPLVVLSARLAAAADAPAMSDAGAPPPPVVDAGVAAAAAMDAGVAAPPATDGGTAAAMPKPPPPKGNMAECPWGISKEMTDRLGAIVEKDFPRTGKCQYAGILTQKTVLDVNWVAEGKAQPPIHVSTRRCLVAPPAGNDEFVVEIPAALTTLCPETATFVANFRGALGKEVVLDGDHDNPQRKARQRPWGVLGLVAVVAVALILWRRSKEPKQG